MPDAFREHFQKASAFYKEGRCEDAVLEFREAIRIDPRSAATHFNLAKSLEKLGRKDEAIEALRSALAADPKHAPSHYSLGKHLTAKGEHSGALKAFEEYIAAAEPKDEKHLETARMYVSQLRQLMAWKSVQTMTLGDAQAVSPLASYFDAKLEAAKGPGDEETLTLGPGAQAAEAGRAPAWSPGAIIEGLYEVRGLLGEGGFGSVHKAYHRGWAMELAVKSPREDRVANRKALERFVQEANTWVGLGLHPHITTCFFVRIIGGLPRIFIEYMEGGSLADWLKSRKVQDAKTALDAAIQIARAMEHAHSRGLVHRDLKPGNCLMTPGGTLKVTDFGLAKVGEEEEEAESAEELHKGAKIAKVREATMTGRLGTPEYMAPEQWRQAGKAAQAADIWAFGVILHEFALAGKPFGMNDGEPPDAFYARMLESGWALKMPAKLDADIREVIASCLSPEPVKRPKDFKLLQERLESAYRRLVGEAYPREAVKAVPLMADALNNQGVSMADLRRSEEALRLFEEALKIDPTHPGALYNRGMLLLGAGKMKAAELISRLAESRKSRPRDWIPGYLMGLAHLRGKDRGSAAKELDGALELSQKNPLIERARRKAEGGAFDDSIELFVAFPKGAESAKMEDSAFRTLMARAEQELALGRWDQACQTIAKARGVQGYEQSAQALELMHRLGHKGVRKGLRAAWRKLSLPGSGSALCACATPDGRHVLSGHEDKTLRLWHISTGALLWSLQAHEGPVSAVCAAANGKHAVSGGADGAVKLWELPSGKPVRSLKGLGGPVCSICTTPDGASALSGNSDKTLRLFDLWLGKQELSVEAHAGSVACVAASPDGALALSGGKDCSLCLWGLPGGGRIRALEGHSGAVLSACILPNGRHALSASADKTLKLWELSTGRCARTFEGHEGPVHGVCATPEGRFALSAGADGKPRLWDLAAGESVWTFEGPQGEASSVCLTPDARRAVFAGAEGVSVWELDWSYVFPAALDWDKEARPYVESFLAARRKTGMSPVEKGLGEEEFEALLEELGRRGFGWLKPEGVRRKLEAVGKEGWGEARPVPKYFWIGAAAAAAAVILAFFGVMRMKTSAAKEERAGSGKAAFAKPAPPEDGRKPAAPEPKSSLDMLQQGRQAIFRGESAAGDDSGEQKPPFIPAVEGKAPDNEAAKRRWGIGLAAFRNGDYERAREEWRLCRQLDPANMDCVKGLQEVNAAENKGLSPLSGGEGFSRGIGHKFQKLDLGNTLKQEKTENKKR
ncbi:MAG: protein kinase [Elusimicrobia bacterium]|nr:protein kinase [Elusimicrobiota bacterium]